MHKNARFFLYAMAFLLPLFAFAEVGVSPELLPPPEPIEQDHFFQEFINMLTTLGLIVATIFFISWFLKRMVNTRIQQVNTSSLIKIIDRRNLSPKSSVYVLEIYNKQFVVGETVNGIATLGEFPIDQQETST